MKIGGKKVVNATKPLILYVNERDIKTGQTKKPDQCAIAKAVRRQLHAKRAKVHLSRTYVEFDDRWVRYATPASARTELISFDRGKKFEEGVYKLPRLRPSQLAIGKRQGSKTESNTRKQRRLRGNKNAAGKHHMITGVRASGLHNIFDKAPK